MNRGRLGNIDNLPKELKDQLLLKDILSDQILNVIKDLDGVANVDEILVGLYRTYKKILKRQNLTMLLYRLTKLNLIESTKGKKGVYTLKEST